MKMINKTELLRSNLELLEEFKKVSQNKLSPGSIRNYISIGKMFLEWLGVKHLFEVSIADIQDYNTELNDNTNISLKTKINRFTLTKRFIKKIYYRHLEEIGVMRNPLFVMKFLEVLNESGEFSKDTSFHSLGRKHIYLTKQEIKILFDKLRMKYPQKYLMFRIYLETGCRRLGVISMKLDCNGIPLEEYLKERIIYIPKGKTGKHIYYCSEDLRDKLLKYVEKRRQIDHTSDILFLSILNKPYYEQTLYTFLTKLVKRMNKKAQTTLINPDITIHTFRRTLNNLRADTGCSSTWLKVLICQKVNDVNWDHYIDKSKGFLDKYDQYNPYKFLQI